MTTDEALFSPQTDEDASWHLSSEGVAQESNFNEDQDNQLNSTNVLPSGYTCGTDYASKLTQEQRVTAVSLISKYINNFAINVVPMGLIEKDFVKVYPKRNISQIDFRGFVMEEHNRQIHTILKNFRIKMDRLNSSMIRTPTKPVKGFLKKKSNIIESDSDSSHTSRHTETSTKAYLKKKGNAIESDKTNSKNLSKKNGGIVESNSQPLTKKSSNLANEPFKKKKLKSKKIKS